MKYDDGIQLNSDRKALKCPLCGNSEIDEADMYCSVCGIMLYNECLNEHPYGFDCYHHNLGNARYCVKCGSETNFSRNGVLPKWSEAKKLNIERLLLEFELAKSTSNSPFLFDWDFVLFVLEEDELLSTALERSKAKIISNKLLIYLYSKEKKELLLSDDFLGYILFNKIEKIYQSEDINLQFKEIVLVAPEDSIEEIYVTDGVPF